MSILATLALVAAALVSCDKDDPKPQPKPFDPNYLEGKYFFYKEQQGKVQKLVQIWFKDKKFRAQTTHVKDDVPRPEFFLYYDRYFGTYTYQDRRITAKIERVMKDKTIGEGPTETEDIEYAAGTEPLLFIDNVDEEKGTISAKLWNKTFLLKQGTDPHAP
ncbi:hypothetical protein HQ37_07375 [Porphyromonas sp. COT-239 OH1446]|nr:hypothetical protein HQ37_07375 [Porphyromonas sp. COT-239 OH1446]